MFGTLGASAKVIDSGLLPGKFGAASQTQHTEISARGTLSPTTNKSALAIASLSVGGLVSESQILVGYHRLGVALNGDVQIGRVTIGRDWIASNLIVGAGAGQDSLFGTIDDEAVASATPIVARIASILIKSSVTGTGGGTDHFGFVAEEIGPCRIGLAKLAFTAGASNDLTGFAVGTSSDFTAREVGSGVL